MPTYATAEDAEDYIAGLAIDNAGDFDRVLERAERDVDSLLGARAPRTDTGLKLDPARLRTFEARALSRAVCAQAEHRLRYLEAAVVTGDDGRTRKRVKGPDFEVEYVTGADSIDPATGQGFAIGTRVAVELAPIAHLRVLTAGTGPRPYDTLR